MCQCGQTFHLHVTCLSLWQHHHCHEHVACSLDDVKITNFFIFQLFLVEKQYHSISSSGWKTHTYLRWCIRCPAKKTKILGLIYRRRRQHSAHTLKRSMLCVSPEVYVRYVHTLEHPGCRMECFLQINLRKRPKNWEIWKRKRTFWYWG